MKVLRKGNIEIGAFEIPDRKKIALAIKTDNEVIVYGYFQSRLGANAFMEELAALVGAEPEEEKECDES